MLKPALLLLAAMTASALQAQELEPRSYANLPVGTRFLLTGYSYSEGGILADPAVRLENADAKVHAGFVGYLQALDVAGRSARLKLLVPYARLSASGLLAGQPGEREVSGPADPALGFSLNLYGAPAVSPAEFADYQQNLSVAVSFLLRSPLGQYDKERLVNIGTNRWTLRSEVALSKTLRPWTFDASLAASFFTDNNEFLGDGTREQEPIYALQLHAIHDFPSGMWASLGGTYYEGGEVNSTSNGESTRLVGPRNSRIGATFSFPVNAKNSIRLQGNTSVSTRAGTTFDVGSLVWQHRWGGSK
ncbi:transporter [Thiohalomonas denitrificans]|uniref:transporter n=1 Tax=Thiohalomonas denitrificans TaxID=415747 RepID=UPI0026E945C9|nr:transporter [Thiohalomonas denitrificans]